MRVIDFHTHAFPDALAGRAIPVLEQQADWKAPLDGKVSSLLKSMDEAGVDISVVCSIATKPKQFQPILEWSKDISSDRLIPFPSLHPSDSDAAEHVRIIHEEGFKGIKFHPYYQDFDLAGERLFPIWENVERYDLIVVVHTGFDIAYPRTRKADPERMAKVIEVFPRLKFVATHLGAWEDWEEVEKHILGRPVYMEVSFSIPYLGSKRAREMMLRHPADCLLFGTDSPWAGQKETLDSLRVLDLGAEREKKILFDNAGRLLGLA